MSMSSQPLRLDARRNQLAIDTIEFEIQTFFETLSTDIATEVKEETSPDADLIDKIKKYLTARKSTEDSKVSPLPRFYQEFAKLKKLIIGDLLKELTVASCSIDKRDPDAVISLIKNILDKVVKNEKYRKVPFEAVFQEPLQRDMPDYLALVTAVKKSIPLIPEIKSKNEKRFKKDDQGHMDKIGGMILAIIHIGQDDFNTDYQAALPNSSTRPLSLMQIDRLILIIKKNINLISGYIEEIEKSSALPRDHKINDTVNFFNGLKSWFNKPDPSINDKIKLILMAERYRSIFREFAIFYNDYYVSEYNKRGYSSKLIKLELFGLPHKPETPSLLTINKKDDFYKNMLRLSDALSRPPSETGALEKIALAYIDEPVESYFQEEKVIQKEIIKELLFRIDFAEFFFPSISRYLFILKTIIEPNASSKKIDYRTLSENPSYQPAVNFILSQIIRPYDAPHEKDLLNNQVREFFSKINQFKLEAEKEHTGSTEKKEVLPVASKPDEYELQKALDEVMILRSYKLSLTKCATDSKINTVKLVKKASITEIVDKETEEDILHRIIGFIIQIKINSLTISEFADTLLTVDQIKKDITQGKQKSAAVALTRKAYRNLYGLHLTGNATKLEAIYNFLLCVYAAEKTFRRDDGSLFSSPRRDFFYNIKRELETSNLVKDMLSQFNESYKQDYSHMFHYLKNPDLLEYAQILERTIKRCEEFIRSMQIESGVRLFYGGKNKFILGIFTRYRNYINSCKAILSSLLSDDADHMPGVVRVIPELNYEVYKKYLTFEKFNSHMSSEQALAKDIVWLQQVIEKEHKDNHSSEKYEVLSKDAPRETLLACVKQKARPIRPLMQEFIDTLIRVEKEKPLDQKKPTLSNNQMSNLYLHLSFNEIEKALEMTGLSEEEARIYHYCLAFYIQKEVFDQLQPTPNGKLLRQSVQTLLSLCKDAKKDQEDSRDTIESLLKQLRGRALSNCREFIATIDTLKKVYPAVKVEPHKPVLVNSGPRKSIAAAPGSGYR